ncbi:solute carrier family 51 subunit beta [Trichomycterus rosablanca]|uniref:solute carrier family 51 subunit beta n=1 Tax=Trichomycterus rosablanca TaxID=2290929 RepID=UPI002F359E1D
MLHVWITLCLLWQGTSSFLIHNSLENLCLEDSLSETAVHLQRCSVDSELQQWTWTDRWFLMNLHTHRCLSAFDTDLVRTVDCDGGDELRWGCENHRLVSLNRSLELGSLRDRLVLTNTGKNTRWKSLDEGDICQEKLRARKQRDVYESPEAGDTMTEEQREYLRWYYRSEDPTPWKFAMLALSLVALLFGCVLCVMDMMSNKHRSKIAVYKAAAASIKVEMEELQVITGVKEDNSYTAPIQDGHPNSTVPVDEPSETSSLKAGDIMVTWKDGKVSNLLHDPSEEEEK